MKFCTSCGQAVTEPARFCGNCGARLQPESADKGKKRDHQRQGRVHQPDMSAPPTHAEPPAIAPEVREGSGFSLWTVLIALGWLFYSSGLLGVAAGQYYFDSNTLERAIGNADWISFGLIIGMPVAIRLFRPVLDILLIPLQVVKSLLPGRVIVGIGLVAPFAVAWLLYDVWELRNYPFLHASLILGTLITYAIWRTPRRFSR